MLNYLKTKFRKLNISLRFSLLTIFTLLFISSATIFISVFYIHVNEIVERAALLLMDEASDRTLEEFNNDIHPFAVVSDFSDELIKDNILNVDNHMQLAGYLLDILKEYPIAERAHWYDKDGFLIYAIRQQDTTLTTEIFNPTKMPKTDEYFYYDKSGKLSKHVTLESDLNWHGSVGYNLAIKKHKSVWTDVFIFQHEPHYFGTSLATPIYQNDGKLRGVLEIDLRLDELSRNLTLHKISENSKMLIINKHGQIIAAPELLTTHMQNHQNLKLPDIENYENVWVKQAFQIYEKTGHTTFSFISNKVRYLATFKPIPVFNDDKWLISIIVPATDFSNRVHKVEFIYLLIFVGIFAIGLFLISNLVSHVVTPIRKLVGETQQIRLFQLESTPRIVSRIKEVIDLSNAIHSMKTGLRSFQKYVPASLVRQLMLAGEDANIGGMKKELAILFSDIQDFTQITDTRNSDDLLKQIYDYFEALSPVVTQNQGTIDKYIGDSMMAFWGAPLPVNNPCHLAAQAALQCKKILKTLNTRWAVENTPLFITRIGIHYGTTIVGNVGSADRLNYTALGSAVNLTNRLVNTNKIYGTSILISDAVYQEIKDTYLTRFVDTVILKGAQNSIGIYELLGKVGEQLSYDLSAYSDAYAKAYKAYQQQAWDDAITLFKRCTDIYPEDSLAPVFIKRCQEFKLQPPRHWQGIWKMREK